jgi:hypothetical protein
MADETGRLFLVTRHLLQGKVGRRGRHFFFAQHIEQQKERAAAYAEEKGEDYLIVRITEQIHVEDSPNVDRIGQYFLINKHMLRNQKLVRRQFFDLSEIDKHRDLGRKYATENEDDFFIVEVLLEISATAEAKKRAEKARRNGQNKKP